MKDPLEGAPVDARAMIQRTFRGGPAHRAGLQRGDVIVAANGEQVKRYQEYIAQARKTEIGQTLSLDLLRKGSPLKAQLEMIEKPSNLKDWRRKHFPGTEAFAWEAEGMRPTGKALSSTDARGRPQLLYFWATWCSPCRQTSPMVDRLASEAGDRLLVAAISSEETTKIARSLLDDTTAYPVGRDSEGMMKLLYEVKSLPTIVLVGSDNQVLAWDYGIGGVRRVVAQARSLLTP